MAAWKDKIPTQLIDCRIPQHSHPLFFLFFFVLSACLSYKLLMQQLSQTHANRSANWCLMVICNWRPRAKHAHAHTRAHSHTHTHTHHTPGQRQTTVTWPPSNHVVYPDTDVLTGHRAASRERTNYRAETEYYCFHQGKKTKWKKKRKEWKCLHIYTFDPGSAASLPIEHAHGPTRVRNRNTNPSSLTLDWRGKNCWKCNAYPGCNLLINEDQHFFLMPKRQRNATECQMWLPKVKGVLTVETESTRPGRGGEIWEGVEDVYRQTGIHRNT